MKTQITKTKNNKDNKDNDNEDNDNEDKRSSRGPVQTPWSCFNQICQLSSGPTRCNQIEIWRTVVLFLTGILQKLKFAAFALTTPSIFSSKNNFQSSFIVELTPRFTRIANSAKLVFVENDQQRIKDLLINKFNKFSFCLLKILEIEVFVPTEPQFFDVHLFAPNSSSSSSGPYKRPLRFMMESSKSTCLKTHLS